jgi:protein TonB
MQFSEPDRLLPAFGIALCLHIAIVLLWQYLDHTQVKPPIRFEIELTQSAPAAQTPASEREITQPKPIPTPPLPKLNVPKPFLKKQQQLLVAKDNTPADQQIPVQKTTEQPNTTPQITPNVAEEPIKQNQPEIASATENHSTESPSTNTVSTQSTRPEEAEPTEAWNGYGQMLYDLVSRNKTYPQIAIRRNWEGKVKIIARFDQGKLVSASIMEAGSGHQVLDDAALDMLRKAVNAMPVRGKLANKIFTVVIPIDFKIEG